MMHTFLANNRDELIERCRAKVAQRPKRAAAANQLRTGVPIFLEQLERTLKAEEQGHQSVSDGNRPLSGATGGVLKRSHAAMKNLIESALNDVKQASPFSARGVCAVAGFIEDSSRRSSAVLGGDRTYLGGAASRPEGHRSG